MRIGIGLPTTTPATTPDVVLDWCRRADDGPFSSLGVLDRLVSRSYEPMTALAAAAAVTSRVRLLTMIVAAPLRSTGVLAKQAASIHALSGGRLTLGMALGARHDDYDVAEAAWAGRGDRFTEQLATLRDHWDDADLAPPGDHGVPDVLVGGMTGHAYLRAARFADGYCHNGGPPRAFAAAAERARAAWRDADRPGAPQVWGQSYVALGDADAGRRYLLDYYAFTGPFAQRIAAGLLDTPKAVSDQVRGYAEAGCDELVLFPATGDPRDLDRLTDAIG